MLRSALLAFLVGLISCPVFAYEALVIACHDGDTVRVRRAAPITQDDQIDKIRLAGIDAPELAQPFGKDARNYLEQLVLGKKVEVEEKAADRYGRKVAEIFTTDGIDVNHELVKQGLAWSYAAYDKHDEELQPLEDSAKRALLGLWADADAEAPWIYRKQIILNQALKKNATAGGNQKGRRIAATSSL